MKRIKDILIKFKDLDPRELEIFLAEILHKDKSFIFARPEHKLSLFQYFKLVYFTCQRKHGYSVAAIIKHKEFYGLDFSVNKYTLIPRPDTEIMVDKAIAEINKIDKKIILIDVGTGSGCIPISIRKTLVNKNINTIAIDISKEALKIARKNAKNHSTDINFYQGNLLRPIIQTIKSTASDSEIIITANLPYLTEKQFQTEPSIWREPKNALVAKNNGLALYEELLQQIKLAQISASIFLEIDPSQSEEIIKIIKQYLPDSNIEIKKDLAGLDRLVKIIN
ncbi:MAG TPA: peptide chain release factor N(5)-glutamine methyltransferase [Candidatus Udaeobacter sp.]|nr:peptide chain release factor N(5)-glutamine methyltransferase [Candidatus Udaeobacter sp.]